MPTPDQACPHCQRLTPLGSACPDCAPARSAPAPSLPDADDATRHVLLGVPAPSPQGALAPGTLLGQPGRYRIERLIGRGGFGQVYQAWDLKLDRACVVKHLVMDPGWDEPTRQLAQQSFEAELYHLAQLNTPGHEHIPDIYDALPIERCLVMKHIEGQSLGTLLKQRGAPFSEREALRYAQAVCAALCYLHARTPAPILHGDLKPENILLGADGRVWLIDFGLASGLARDVPAVATERRLGTLGYTPPEQWLGQLSPAGDMYAFGATLYALLTGAPPRYPPEDDRFVPPRRLNPLLSPEVERLILYAMQPAASARPTAAACQAQVEALLAARTVLPGPSNLPPQLTSFIGRDEDLREVAALVATTRVVTLAGPGGIGKTRLALEVAPRLLERFPDGIWLVDLATLSDPALLPSALAAVFGIQPEPDRTLLATTISALRAKTLLVMLDNCEHLRAACASLIQHLLGCPRLHVLATSRAVLGLPGEAVRFLAPLSVPDERALALGPAALAAALGSTDAARLFVERAQAARPGFALTPRAALPLARICAQLDGLPLALELAAARMRMLSIEQLEARMHERFRLLADGDPSASPRRQTLEALIAWSYDLLDDDERRLLRWLAVFCGPTSLEELEAVMAPAGLPSSAVVELVGQLVNKSLVVVQHDQDGVGSFRLLETIRAYAAARLQEAGEEAQARAQHLRAYASAVRALEPTLWTAEQGRGLALLAAQHPNLRTALRTALDLGAHAEGLELAVDLWRYWYIRGHAAEGQDWIEALLAGDQELPGSTRARALLCAGHLAWIQGAHRRAQELAEQALTLCRALGDEVGEAFSLTTLGLVAWRQAALGQAEALLEQARAHFQALEHPWGMAIGAFCLGLTAQSRSQYRRATALFEESLGRYQALGDRWGMAVSFQNLVLLAERCGAYAQARALLEESLQLCRAIGDSSGVAFSLRLLGSIAQHEGAYARGMELLEQSLALYREQGSGVGLASALVSLADLLTHMGDYGQAATVAQEALARARELEHPALIAYNLTIQADCALHQRQTSGVGPLLEESMAIFAALDDQPMLIYGVEQLAWLDHLLGRSGAAVERLGGTTSLRDQRGLPVPPSDRPAYEARLLALSEVLGAAEFARRWAQGSSRSLEDLRRLDLA